MRSVIRIVVCLTLLLFMISCKCKDQKEIDAWKFSPYEDKLCPILGGYPLFIKNLFPKPHKTKYAGEIKQAYGRWNKVAAKWGKFKFFEPVDRMAKYETARHKKIHTDLVKKGHNRVFPFVVELRDAPQSEKKFRGLCELLKLGAAEDFQSMSMARTEFKGKVVLGGRYIYRVVIYVCLEKYERGIKLMNTPVAQKLKEFGMQGVLRHELGHLLIGHIGGSDKQGHPSWYGDVMKGMNQGINYHTIELIRQRVYTPCKKNGLLLTVP